MCPIAVNVAVLNMSPSVRILKYPLKNMHTITLVNKILAHERFIVFLT